MLLTFLFLVLIAAVGFWRSRSKNIKIPKKIIFSSLAIGLILIILSVDTIDSKAATDLTAEVNKNEQLVENISELEDSNTGHQEEIVELENATDESIEKITQLEEENESLSADIDTLKANNEKLKKELKEKEKKETASISKKDSNSEKQDTKSRTSQKNKSNTNSVNSSKDTSKETTETETATSFDTAQAVEDCKIKGSENGIYHTPGSTYYSRTTNVAQWFCSEKEAENAGYRAPKR